MPVPLSPFPSRVLWSDLIDLLETYLEAQEIKEVDRAFFFSAYAHEDQKRKTGEPYINHPLGVAYILGQMQMDTATISAALLHDVIEDTDTSKEQLSNEFGELVAELVDGVSKLKTIHFKTREQANAESFQKLIMAMTSNPRVIIIKLADRLHNMRTIEAMKLASQKRIARETLEVYIPIANRLGMNEIRIELEELCFKTLYPLRYQVLDFHLNVISQQRADTFDKIEFRIKEQLDKKNIQAQLMKRNKHYYGIYYKMLDKKKTDTNSKIKSFSQVNNTCPLRIIVNNEDDCYRVFGVVQNLYKPKGNEYFKDHIAIPKTNGYQSIHTTLQGSDQVLIEVQIRTDKMDERAEKGITTYIRSPDQLDTSMNEWVQQLLDMHRSTEDSLEFYHQVKECLYPEEVYVFTPQGEIKILAKGATAIDFAYAIHSKVGNHCYKAKINNEYVSLNTALESGQTVQIFTESYIYPQTNWLDFAKTHKARSEIRNFIKNYQYKDALKLGKEMLDKELSVYSLSIEQLNEQQKACLLKTFHVKSLDSLLADIGLGNKMAWLVACQFDSTATASSHDVVHKQQTFPIKGTEGSLVKFASCCHPIPQDHITGIIHQGKGLAIHRMNCKKLHHNQNKLLPVEWKSEIEKQFSVEIEIKVYDQKGVLAVVATILADMNSNIENFLIKETHGDTTVMIFTISVFDRKHLANIMRKLKRLDIVIHIGRR
jgi:RelA/SpoT family (p)ppGpp synthetase